MKIRTKLLLLLLVISLVPLGVTAYLHWRSMHRLGEELASGQRQQLAASAEEMLARLVGDYGRVLDRDRAALEQAVRFQAREVERRLASPVQPARRLWTSADYDTGRDLPEGVAPSDRHFRTRPDGEREAVPVSYAEQVFFVVGGVADEDVAADMQRLATMPDAYRFAYQANPELMYWQYTSLDCGIHTSYPGHGGYPEDYDPRVRDWYTRARDAGDVVWLVMPEVSSRTVTQAVAAPVYGPSGSFAGVTAIDVPFNSMFRELSLPADWSSGAETMLAIADSEGADDGRLPRVLVQRGYERRGGDWRTPVEIQRLQSDDLPGLTRLLRAAREGRPVVGRLPHNGSDSLWAVGAVRPAELFPVVVVRYDRVIARAVASGEHVVRRTVEEQRLTGLIVAVVVALSALLALVVARTVSRPVSELAFAAQRLSEGDYDAQVGIRTGDELAELGRTFNSVGPRLREREQMKASLALAMQIQQQLLPKGPPQVAGFDIAGKTVYCDETGGDYYDFIDLSSSGPDRLGVVVGDVSGHGIGAALLMAAARGVLRSHAEEQGDDLGGVLSALNLSLVRDSSDERFMTLFYAVLDGATRSVRWSSGGHDPALLLRRASGEFESLPNTGMPVGMVDAATFDAAGPIKLEPGDVLVIGTDGIWEARSEGGEMFGKERLRRLVHDLADLSAAGIYDGIAAAHHDFTGAAPQLDDITLVVIKVT